MNNKESTQIKENRTVIESQEETSYKYIVIELNDELFAISLYYVQEVLDINKYQRIPLIKDKIAGIYNLRGELLPLINFDRILFTQQEHYTYQNTKKQLKILVIKTAKDKFGLIVKEIIDIRQFSEENFKNIPSKIQTALNIEHISAIVRVDNSIIKILNIKEILEKNFNAYFSSIVKEVDNNPEKENRIMNVVQGEIENQKTKKDQKQPIKLFLNEQQQDALKEICNIASGNAVVALSNLFSKKTKIEMTIADLLIKNINEFDNVGIDAKESIIGIKAQMKNDINASIFLLFPSNEFPILLKELENLEDIPQKIDSIVELPSNLYSAIKEIGNIIISHYCSGLSNLLKIKVYHEVPEIAVDFYGSLMDSEMASIAQQSDQAIFLQTLIKIKQKSINGQIIFIPYHDSMELLMERLDADVIVRLMDNSEIKPQLKDSETQKDAFQNVQAQMDYHIEDSDKKDMFIDDSDLDAFRELGNIGAGNAGNALSQMLNKKVFLEIPPAKVMKLPDLIANYGKTKLITGYVGFTKGFFEAILVLMFPTNYIENLLQHIMESDKKKSIKKESDLNSNEKSAVIEMLNILMGHYIAALGDFMKIMIEPPEYQFVFKTANSLFNQLKIPVDDNSIKAIVVETSINVSDSEPIKGEFVLLLHPLVVQRILKRIKEIWQS